MKKIFLILLLLLFSNIYSQTSGSWGFSDAASNAMARTYTARAFGVDAIGVNPANIAMNSTHFLNFATIFPIPSINLTFKSPLDIDSYNYYFGGVTDANGKTVGRHLNATEKSDLKALIGSNKFLFNFNLTYLSICVNPDSNIGSFGFSIADKMGSDFQIAEALVDFVFSGNSILKNYALSDIFAKTTAYREYSLSYARRLNDSKIWEFDRILAGVSFKLISGFGYVGTNKNNSYFNFSDRNKVVGSWDYEVNTALPPDFVKNYGKDSIQSIKSPSISPFPTVCGSGFGFDIGFSAIFQKNLVISIALTDIGSITWDKNTATLSGSGNFTFEGFSTKEALDSLKNKFENIKNDVGTSFSSSLPTTFRLGFAYRLDKAPFIKSFPGELLLALDYNQGFNNEVGNSTTPRVSLGTEWKPGSWIAIRTGISFGGAFGSEWAFGFGYFAGPLSFNLTLMNPVSLFSLSSAKKILVGFDSRWTF